MKCLPVSDAASLFQRILWTGLMQPREHLVLGSPALHIITWQLMYT